MAGYNTEKINRPNLAEKYSGWTLDLVKKDLKESAFPFAVMMEHWQGDFNIGTCFRNANAFGARELFYLGGKRKYDPRGCVGVQYYSDIKFLENYNSLLSLKDRYVFIGIDNVPGSVSMENFQWPKNALMIFGEESKGLTEQVIQMCDKVVAITQYGSVRSLNAGTASGIAMFSYTSQIMRQ